MLVRSIAGATRRLAKDQPQFTTLPIRDGVTDVDGVKTHYMVSAWEPTPADLTVLQNGGSLVCNLFLSSGEKTGCIKTPDAVEIMRLRRGVSVLLSVPGKNHPPVSVFTVDAETVKSSGFDKSEQLTVITIQNDEMSL